MRATLVARLSGLAAVVLLALAVCAPRVCTSSAAAGANLAAEQADPQDGRGLWDEGEHLRDVSRYEEALAVFERITKDCAATQFAQPAQMRAAECLAALGRPADAAAAYRQVERFPRSRVYGADWAGGARYQLARLLEQQGEIAEAIVAYRLATEWRNMWRGQALRSLAALYRKQRQYPEAIQAYLDLAHTAASWIPLALSEMAATYMEADQMDHFVDQCDKLARLYPKSRLTAETLLKLAALYQKEGKSERALLIYNRVAHDFAGLPEGESALWKTGQALEASGSRLAAAEAYRGLVRMYCPQDPPVRMAARRLEAMGLAQPGDRGDDRLILIDETHGEARTDDIADQGFSNWAGQREVFGGLMEAGYVVHVLRSSWQAPAGLSSYAAIIVNGGQEPRRYAPGDLRDLTEYVSEGGALLVVSGPWPETASKLLAAFGLGFAPVKPTYGRATAVAIAAEDRSRFAFLPDNIYVSDATEVTGQPDVVLVHRDGAPLVAATRRGKGIVVAASVGTGFMGTGLSTAYHKSAPVNLKLLVDLMSWMLQSAGGRPLS